MITDAEFESIRPYTGDEIKTACGRLSQSKEFLAVFSGMTKYKPEQIVAALSQIYTAEEFQSQFFSPTVEAILKNTTDGVTISGMENIPADGSFLFISNHRDIILDSAILNLYLRANGKRTVQSAVGSNLLVNQWVTDLVKLNGSFIIERGDIPRREMVNSFALRSKYIRDTILEGCNSVWIAEREGRTKNGDDKTQPSLLKMFNMSGPKDFAASFTELHIVPVAISYEWEPCDDLKTSELYTRTVSEYIKTPEEDMHSMRTGLETYKGHVHIAIDKPLADEIAGPTSCPSNGERLAALAHLIDKKIYANFKLWPNNFVAYDLLHSVNKYASHYSIEEKERFIQIMTQKIERIEGNRSMLNNLFLEIYANPVKNCLEGGVINGEEK